MFTESKKPTLKRGDGFWRTGFGKSWCGGRKSVPMGIAEEHHGLEGEESQDHGLKTVKAEEKESEGERATTLADKGRELEEGLKG